ncbi:MAG TPA: 3-hydroxybutyrate dehydrogenase [Pseudobdellovibrionaceae bacterium]|nr:3-hydroxybutyrate dehydrogenase [Pseudobdellovibrionaceae bacterium]
MPSQKSWPELNGRNALITGSTSGIGWGLARALAEQGVHVTLNGLVQDQREFQRTHVEALAAECGVRVRYSGADLANPSQIQSMMQEHVAEFGGLDILINNAGIQHVSPVENFPPEKWDQILAINLSSNFHTLRAAIPVMKRQGRGRLVQIASVHGLVASPFKSAYVAAKHAVIGLTKAVALELADTPITCNAICPGYVRTPLVEGQIDQQARAHGLPPEQVVRDVILAAQPRKEFIEVDDLAQLCLFVCSDAGKTMTGAALNMDGGWTAR